MKRPKDGHFGRKRGAACFVPSCILRYLVIYRLDPWVKAFFRILKKRGGEGPLWVHQKFCMLVCILRYLGVY